MRKRKPPPGPGVPREAWGRVHPQLDLHGMTGEEARRRTEQWLRDRQAEGVRTVVVVTGRGLHSMGIPVVRNEVEHLLALLKGTMVARWESANAGGSFRIELRRPPPDATPRAPAPPRRRACWPRPIPPSAAAPRKRSGSWGSTPPRRCWRPRSAASWTKRPRTTSEGAARRSVVGGRKVRKCESA